MRKEIPIRELLPGMVITRVLEQNGPVNVRKSGLVTSSDMVSGLAEMGVLTVEIDSAQTVEIAGGVTEKPAERSRTTQLLSSSDGMKGSRADANVTYKTDSHLSEQFNRRLLIPSSQTIPSGFSYYLKPAATALLLAVGGVCVGYNLSQFSTWVTLLNGPAFTQTAAQMNTPTVVYLPAPQQTPDTQSASTTGAPNPSHVEPQSSITRPADIGNIAETSDNDTVTQSTDDYAGGEVVNEPSTTEITSGISPDLLKKFEAAIAAVDDDNVAPLPTTKMASPDVPPIHELPAWVLTDLPSLSFSAHMYASNPSERWISVNGMRLSEGELIADGLYLVAIEPQHVILAFKGHEFSMNALTDW
ncbi:general secretion pathway protein GspB [Aestuariibacter sp. AA17]|uniref:General secretion pathway protein GspB n=1 Tax=Fluctibacter corallii TaxID=2984329 RepID=A0ABT3A7Z9_9ALTE|nr:general secretion pathway protein GspB [Aestuariibacter sp. AA17]MCV2884813.1 general secretion pathway protein GspB [Aestuariibacter sp. AA17]